MRLDFKASDCRWNPGAVLNGVKQPDELHVTPEDSDEGRELAAYLTAEMGNTVQSVGHSVTPYLVSREVGGVFILTNARVNPRGAKL